MKSKVLNTKHINEKIIDGHIEYTCLISDIKPSFFKNNPDKIFLQDKVTNKMSQWKLQEASVAPRVLYYKPMDKFVKKFPKLENATFTASE